VGAIWGLGHGISATIIGYAAFFLKGKLSGKFLFLQKLTTLAESAVGLSLVAIGLLGIKESLEKDDDQVENNTDNSNKESLNNSDSSNNNSNNKKLPVTAIFTNGMLHGFSWDGAPSIAPALAMSSWKTATMFLASYSIGTVIMMSLAASAIGIVSSQLGQISKSPDFPKRISFFSSLIAMLIGVYWIWQGFQH
jgi:hypothetical protein